MVHEKLFNVQVVVPQTIFTFVVQCENFSMLVFSRVAFTIDISIKIISILLCLHESTIIIHEFELTSAKTNKVGCICNRNDEPTIANRRKCLTYKNNYNYDNVSEINMYSSKLGFN